MGAILSHRSKNKKGITVCEDSSDLNQAATASQTQAAYLEQDIRIARSLHLVLLTGRQPRPRGAVICLRFALPNNRPLCYATARSVMVGVKELA